MTELSPIQGYRHPWVMNKREFIEAYNRIMDNIAPDTTIPYDRIRIPSVLDQVSSVIGPVALITSAVPYINVATRTANGVVGFLATATSVPQMFTNGLETYRFNKELSELKKYVKNKCII